MLIGARIPTDTRGQAMAENCYFSAFLRDAKGHVPLVDAANCPLSITARSYPAFAMYTYIFASRVFLIEKKGPALHDLRGAENEAYLPADGLQQQDPSPPLP